MLLVTRVVWLLSLFGWYAQGYYYPDYSEPVYPNYDYDDSDDLSLAVTPYCPYGKLVYNRCQCPRLCPLRYDPVCGSDGKTYSCICRLQVAACATKKYISVKHEGACYPKTQLPEYSCANIRCIGSCVDTHVGPTCVPRQIKPAVNTCAVRLCPPGYTCNDTDQGSECIQNICTAVCSKKYKPVCATNGVTYRNICEMRVRSCTSRQVIEFKHDGECRRVSRCAVILCSPGTICEEGLKGAKCVKKPCPTVCTKEYRPLCGTDGKTYGNLCQLKSAGCQASKAIGIKHEGRCDRRAYCNRQNLYCRRRYFYRYPRVISF